MTSNLARLAIAPMIVASASAAQSQSPGTFMLFFEYEGAEITPYHAGILARFVDLWRVQPERLIRVSGHADRAHGNEESLAISRRRAWAAHDWLVTHGVPPRTVSVSYYGEQQPLVETGDDVREPQNRRVEIGIQNPG